MDSLFAISMNTIMRLALALFVAITALVAALALRHRLLFALAMRNIPRRWAQTILIIVGLMLGTTIITAAFGTGDTMTYSIRAGMARSLGTVDEIVTANATTSYGAIPVSASLVGRVRASLPAHLAAGVTGAIVQPLALQDLTTRQTKATVELLGVPATYPAAFGPLTTRSGATVTLGQLPVGQVYVNAAAQEALNAHAGDRLRLFIAGHPVAAFVRDVLRDENLAEGGLLSGGLTSAPAVLLPLDRAQALLGQTSQVTEVLISNRGDALSGAALTDSVTAALRATLAASVYQVQPVKQQGLAQADQAGSTFLTIFLVFGLFSIAVGLLLIFLIFVMLAAERRTEMGMARAIGTRRHQLIALFLFEGYLYDLGAAAVGIAIGIGVGLGMTAIIAALLGTAGIAIQPHIAPRSVAVAFCLGAVVTFLTVACSAWRVSRLTIVAAIRDLPEERGIDPNIGAAFLRPLRDLGRAGRRLRGGHPLGALAALLAASWHLVSAFRVFISRGPVLLVSATC